MGLVCIFFAVIIGKLAGIPDGEILKGFKPNLFINLMGVTLLFSILNKNGTIELLARKIVSLAGSNKYLIPIAVFLMGACLPESGRGPFPCWPSCRPLPSFGQGPGLQPSDAGHHRVQRLFRRAHESHYPGRTAIL